jgi:methyl-accepting chemotaxis protein
MRKKKAKSVIKKQRKTAWDSIVIASIDTLPKGVFMLLKTSATSPTDAAQQKAQRAGIPGDVTVVQQHPLNKSTGNVLFADLLRSFKQFPYGDSNFLVKATGASIKRKYEQLSSNDPNQIELRKTLYEAEVDEQLLLLKETRKTVQSLKAEAERLESLVAELNDEKQRIVEEIDELERDREPLDEFITNLRGTVQELRTVYRDLEELAEYEGDEVRGDSYWERRVLVRKISDWVDAHYPE